MKKALILTFVLFIFGSLSSKAQALIGARAGYQFSSSHVNGNQEGDLLNSFYIGVFRKKDVIPLIDYQYGLEYMQNGWFTNDNNFRRIHYLSIPLDLRIKVGPVYGLGGMAANIKLGETLKLNGSDALNSNNKTSGFDLPVFLGAGVKIAILSLEARYYWGTFEVRPGAYNQYFQLGLGISL